METNFLNNKKIWLWAVSGIFVVFGFLWWLGIIGFWADNVKDYFLERSRDQYFQNAEKESALLKELYKNDTYGGDTPEETWTLFVDALEKGNTDLASKYFVVEKQEEMKIGFKSVVKNNYLDKMKNDLVNNYKKEGYSDKNNDFRYVKKNSVGVIVGEIILALNKETNKWKILEL